MESQSLSPQDETDTVANHYYSALDVADAFVKQYYHILQAYPKDAHNFYKDQSVRSHPSVEGLMKTVTTLKDIEDEIITLNIKEWNPDMSTIYAQDSVMESVIVGVTGSLIDNDDVSRNFAQTFFLAPQEGGGFYVHNDFLQFIEIKKLSETSPPLDDTADPLVAQQANDTAKDSSLENAQPANEDQTEKSTVTKQDGDTKVKVSESSKENNPPPAESKKKSQPSPPNVQEDSTKISYASVLAKEGSGPSTSQPSSDTIVKVMPNTEKRASTSLGVAKPSVKSSMISNNGAFENIYDVKAIRVKDLPPNMTEESLLEVVKQFGPVRLRNIQIKEYLEDGYRYAFVEFDNPKSARNAMEARFIQFEDRESEIQYKKIPHQGGHNYNGRPQFGRGGFRNNNYWGRDGDGHGSGSRGNKRVDHENFGQHSGHTRDYNNRRNRYFQDR